MWCGVGDNLASDVKTQTKYGTVAGTALTGANYTLVSNPCFSGEIPGDPDGWTLTKRDPANRVVSVETFSGSAEPNPFGDKSASTGATTWRTGSRPRLAPTAPRR